MPSEQHPPNYVPLGKQPGYKPLRKIRLVAIGAGFGGLSLAHKVQHAMKLEDEIDLVIYDRNDGIGGTWFENSYPGAACDVPAHAYVFPFEPNPNWSSFYAGQPEILAYMQHTVKKWNLLKHVQLNTEIVEAVWNEFDGQWNLKIRTVGGEVRQDYADVLVNCTGFLNHWKWPNIEGLHDFKGKLVHSARWDNAEYKDKRVAVIGNGASGIQITRSIAPDVKSMTVYMRSPTYISTNFLEELTPEGGQFSYSEEQKKKWREDPKAFFDYLREVELHLNRYIFALVNGHPAQEMVSKRIKERMHEALKNAPELEKQLTPSWVVGCRRLTPGDGYLEALQQDNVRTEWTSIDRFTEKGILLKPEAEGEAGREEEFDLIVCATGFDTSFIPNWKQVGRNGSTMDEMWKEDPEALWSVHVIDQPNYFVINGPNIPISHGTVLTMMGWVCDHILRWTKKINCQDIHSVVPKPESVADYNEYQQEFLRHTSFADKCRAWYKNDRSEGRLTGVYGGTMMHFKEGLETLGAEHFDVKWRSANRFSYLGNGTAECDENGAGDVAPYFTWEYFQKVYGGFTETLPVVAKE
ncbi:flavin-binding monooxygenase [Grosmannia clavigera kw1407]|uniref:Flavin-binding monooxygenase n=1 Tax=Grosmannia clavigera (strain kw1407 / UAMH 11150) TaxID=655863 RepID=F0XKX9_GROCL|nr:flavin-binding monooxygenase [Grosmannia clavigera kw1407]EFX01715.1 flavin-binding monooxygenase [Grosmannia clavigera kw1407]